MVTQNGIGIDALDSIVRNEHRINVSKEGVGRSLCHSDLELLVALGTLGRIVGLTSLLQPLVHLCVGVAGVVSACIGGEDLVGVVVSIVGRAPADDAALLSAPVNAVSGNIGLYIQTSLLELLSRDL